MINTPYRDGIAIALLVAANVAIEEGELVAVNADGHAVPATDGNAVTIVGRSEDSVNADNPVTYITVTRNRQFLLNNDASAPLTQADFGSDVMLTAAVNTVTKSDDTGLVVGRMMSMDYDTNKVWVEIT